MTSVPHTQVSLPTELVESITPEAKASGVDVNVFLAQFIERAHSQAKSMGMNLNTYVHFIANVGARGHDAAFVDAAKYTMTRYPDAMKKLAQ